MYYWLPADNTLALCRHDWASFSRSSAYYWVVLEQPWGCIGLLFRCCIDSTPCVTQNRQLDKGCLDSKAPRLHVDLYTGPQAKTADLQICRRADGSLWLLGEGACGKVYKVRPGNLPCTLPGFAVSLWACCSRVIAGYPAIQKACYGCYSPCTL